MAGHQLVIHHSKSLLTSDRKAGTTGAGMCVVPVVPVVTALVLVARVEVAVAVAVAVSCVVLSPRLCPLQLVLGFAWELPLHTLVSCPHLAMAGSCRVQSICFACCTACACYPCKQNESILAIALNLAFVSICRVDVIAYYPINTRHACNTCISIRIIH